LSFVTSGQVYVKMLPSGDPVQLTHDDLRKLSPVFSPDGSRIAYAVVGRIWDTWAVPVLVLLGHKRSPSIRCPKLGVS